MCSSCWLYNLRLEIKQHGIDVIIVEPGIIKTEFGDVMTEPMMERSGNGAYANMTKSVQNTTKNSYKKGSSSPSSVIANVISKAIHAKKPKTRYVARKLAKPMMIIRKYFGDRIFDMAMMSQVKCDFLFK